VIVKYNGGIHLTIVVKANTPDILKSMHTPDIHLTDSDPDKELKCQNTSKKVCRQQANLKITSGRLLAKDKRGIVHVQMK